MEVKLEMKDLILKNQSGKNSREAITIFLIIFNNI